MATDGELLARIDERVENILKNQREFQEAQKEYRERIGNLERRADVTDSKIGRVAILQAGISALFASAAAWFGSRS